MGDFLILRAVRESNGLARAVDDPEILAAREEIAQVEGLLTCPEGAATYAAYKQALARDLIPPDASVVLFNCASGLKYPIRNPQQFSGLNRTTDFRDFTDVVGPSDW
jgi:threonine synthase